MSDHSPVSTSQVPTSPVAVAAIQSGCSTDSQENVDIAVDRIRAAAKQGANIVCLQELFATPYPCQSEEHDRFAWAEPIPGPTSERLGRVAAECEVVLVGSLFERRAAGVYHNTAIVWDADGEVVGRYRKMHIPDDPGYYEKFYFAPGDLGFNSFDTRFGRVGVCVCWDQWFPEAARLTALTGAEFIFYPTAIGWLKEEKETYGASQTDAWETMMRSHAIANGVYVIAANRVGVEGGIEFWGRSFIANPYGQVVARGGEAAEIVQADCQASLIETARTHWPFLRDRRVDAYSGLTQRYLDQPS